jgi:PKD repeat protein
MQCYEDKTGNELTPDQVKAILIDSARQPWGCPSEGDNAWGHGIVDACAAIQMVESGNVPVPLPKPDAQVRFEKPEYRVNDKDGALDVEVILSGELDHNVTVKCEALGGSGAIPGQDFSVPTQVLDFSPGETRKPLQIKIINSPASKENLAFTLKLSSDENLAIPTDSCKVTIIDTDQAQVKFAVDSYTVKAKNGEVSFPVEIVANWSRDPLAGDIRVKVSTVDGSADSGQDYVALEDYAVVIPRPTDGSTKSVINITLTLKAITVSQCMKYFTIKLSDPVNASLETPSIDTVWIAPVTIDITVPEVHCTVTTTTPPSGWYNSDVTVSLSANDDGQDRSGINYLKYSVNDGPETKVDSSGSPGATISTTGTISEEGILTVACRATDNSGNAIEGQPVIVKIDKTAPTTLCTLRGVPGTANVVVSLGSSDGPTGSGVATINYNTSDNPTIRPYNGEFTVLDGSGYVCYYAEDVAGNKEEKKAQLVELDNEAPVTTAVIAGVIGTNGWYRSEVNVTLSTTDSSGVRSTNYSYDGVVWTAYDGPFNITTEGLTVLSFNSTDNKGNRGDVQSLNVRIDRAAPVTTSAVQGVAGSGNVLVNMTAEDGPEGSGIAWILYNTSADPTFREYRGEFQVPDGSGSIWFYSKDNASNMETPKPQQVSVDTVVPVTTPSLVGTIGTNGWYISEVNVTLSAEDNTGGSGVRSTSYSCDGVNWTAYHGPFNVSKEGLTVLTYHATDNAGNVEVNKTTSIKIDSTAPITTCSMVPDTTTGWTNQETQVTLHTDDTGGSAIDHSEYRLSTSDLWSTYSGPFNVTQNGETGCFYRSVDLAGNIEAPNVQRVAIDRISPVITYATVPAAPNGDGWYYGNVMVIYNATDSGGSDIEGRTNYTDTVIGPGTGLMSSWTVKDRAGNSATVNVGPFNIRAAALALGNISAPQTPLSVGTTGVTISVNDTFTTGDSLTSSTWGWDDGTANTAGTISGNVISATHKYTKPGIYTVTLTARDSTGATVNAKFDYVVVYDPSCIMTAAGIVGSPKGAYYPVPTMGGFDIFAAYSEYIKGTMVANSFCDFNYNSGTLPCDDLLFLSTSSDWLVVSGNKAYYQGTGMLMDKKAGSGTQYLTGYKFLYSGIDGDKAKPKTKDKFRMKIWDPATGVVKYDNGFNAVIDADPTTAITLGDINVKG